MNDVTRTAKNSSFQKYHIWIQNCATVCAKFRVNVTNVSRKIYRATWHNFSWAFYVYFLYSSFFAVSGYEFIQIARNEPWHYSATVPGYPTLDLKCLMNSRRNASGQQFLPKARSMNSFSSSEKFLVTEAGLFFSKVSWWLKLDFSFQRLWIPSHLQKTSWWLKLDCFFSKVSFFFRKCLDFLEFPLMIYQIILNAVSMIPIYAN